MPVLMLENLEVRLGCDVAEVSSKPEKLAISHGFGRMTFFECMNLQTLTRIQCEVPPLAPVQVMMNRNKCAYAPSHRCGPCFEVS